MTSAQRPPWPPEVPPPGTPTTPEWRPPGTMPPGRPPPTPGPAQPPTPPTQPIPLVYDDRHPQEDLADRLLERRTVLVSGLLDLPASTAAAARLMLLDGTGDEPIELMLTCPDGDLVAAMALADTVELVGVELRTVCAGLVGGPAVLPFAMGTRRLVQPHASLRLSEPELEVSGRGSEVVDAAARHADLVADLHRRLARATGQREDTIATDARRRLLLTAPEAVAYGLADEIQRRLRAV